MEDGGGGNKYHMGYVHCMEDFLLISQNAIYRNDHDKGAYNQQADGYNFEEKVVAHLIFIIL